jgi:hypothetical protein
LFTNSLIDKNLPDKDRFATEVAGLLGDDVDLSTLPAVLRKPGPQPCNQIPLTKAEAMRRFNAGRRRWPQLAKWLRIGRAVRRLVRATVASEVRALVAELIRQRSDIAAIHNGRPI